jgi:hypothetical protein
MGGVNKPKICLEKGWCSYDKKYFKKQRFWPINYIKTKFEFLTWWYKINFVYFEQNLSRTKS